jgi:beta-alanine degradation protein BauB
MAAQTTASIELGPIGDKVIFENDAIRVWSFSVPPGGIKRMHRHDLPYLIVPMTGGRVELTTIQGKVRYGDDKKGEAFFLEAGETHQLRNLSDHTYENVLVELKKH